MLNGNVNYSSKLPIFLEKTIKAKSVMQRIKSEESQWTREAGWKNYALDIMSFHNSPLEGLTTYITMGLSEYELRDNQNNRPPLRVELVSVLKDNTDFDQLTGNCNDKKSFYEDALIYISCYNIIKEDYLAPGDVWIRFFSNKYQYQFSDLEHLFFMRPILLNDKLIEPIQIDDQQVEFILCVPITESELVFYQKNGAEALEELLLKEQIDVSDLFRKPVV
ncbi:MAG: suppressor of fused domain protein [Firmicutes bacterium]|nr:suppressor of fused domain protein [Bacillota bacterium]